MSEKQVKRYRRIVGKEVKQHKMQLVRELFGELLKLSLLERLRIAWKIVWKT